MSNIDVAIHALRNEAFKAMVKHSSMCSAHEGRSVIREECDELFEHVRADTGGTSEARKEAIQSAAMGLRYAHDVCGCPLEDALAAIRRCIDAASKRRGRPLKSAHEGHAYMMDWFSHLFGRVSDGSGAGAVAQMFALELSAAAVEYAVDICGDAKAEDERLNAIRAEAMKP